MNCESLLIIFLYAALEILYLFFEYGIESLLQTVKTQRNSLIGQQACGREPHTYTFTPPEGGVARSFNWGANLLDTAASGRD